MMVYRSALGWFQPSVFYFIGYLYRSLATLIDLYLSLSMLLNISTFPPGCQFNLHNHHFHTNIIYVSCANIK